MIIISVNKHLCGTLSFMKLQVVSSHLLTVNSVEETNIYYRFPNEFIPFINVLIIYLIPSRIFPEIKAFSSLKNLEFGNSWPFLFVIFISCFMISIWKELFFYFHFYVRGTESERKGVPHQLVHSPKARHACPSWAWARLKLGF